MQLAANVLFLVGKAGKFTGGQAVPGCKGIGPHKAFKTGLQQTALHLAAQGIDAVQHYQFFARSGAVPHHIQQGGNVSIKPRADILDIIDHGIYQVQHLRRHVLGILAVQAVHRQSGGGIGVCFHGSTGVMVAAYAVLRAEQRCQRELRVDGINAGCQHPSYAGCRGDQAEPPPFQPGRGVSQVVKTIQNHGETSCCGKRCEILYQKSLPNCTMQRINERKRFFAPRYGKIMT